MLGNNDLVKSLVGVVSEEGSCDWNVDRINRVGSRNCTVFSEII